MSRTITITVPDRVYDAMKAKGQLYECGAGDYLRQFVIASAMGAEIPLGLAAVIARQDEARASEGEQLELKTEEEDNALVA